MHKALLLPSSAQSIATALQCTHTEEYQLRTNSSSSTQQLTGRNPSNKIITKEELLHKCVSDTCHSISLEQRQHNINKIHNTKSHRYGPGDLNGHCDICPVVNSNDVYFGVSMNSIMLKGHKHTHNIKTTLIVYINH